MKFFNIKIWFPIVLALAFYYSPLEGLNESAKRVGCIFIIAALYWVLEVMPIYVTSLFIISLELLFLSNKTFSFFQISKDSEAFVFTQNQIFGSFASPIIILFLGGFFLALAATKHKLDINLASLILKFFGNNKHMVLLGLMLVTATFSMFMSNTATTAMMLAIVYPIFSNIPENDNLRTSIALSIPIAANIGGMGTPIGTPPNAVALGALEKIGLNISFIKWMLLGLPFVIIMLLICWGILILLFPSSTKKVSLEIKSNFSKTANSIFVYIVFITTILLWLTSGFHGLSSAMIGFIPVVLFSMTQIISKKDLGKISWDILWLVSGGLALGTATDKTGLSKWILSLIPFADFPIWITITGVILIGILMSTFISNTASANLLIPIAISLSAIMPENFGKIALPVILAFSCSLAMSLPISTPPNALAFSTGQIQTKQLLKIGIIIGMIGIIMLLLFIKFWQILRLI